MISKIRIRLDFIQCLIIFYFIYISLYIFNQVITNSLLNDLVADRKNDETGKRSHQCQGNCEKQSDFRAN